MFVYNRVAFLVFLALTPTVFGKKDSVRGGSDPVVQGEYSDADEYPCVPGPFVSNAGSGVPLTSVARKGTRTRSYKPIPPPTVTGPFEGFNPTYFDSYRYGVDQGDGTKNEFTYLYDQCEEAFEYEVTLGFAEINPDMCEIGKRVFDITVNGDFLVRGFDVVEAGGGECNKAIFLTKTYSALGGELYLRFAANSRSTSNAGPMVSLISIKPKPIDGRRLKECDSGDSKKSRSSRSRRSKKTEENL